MNPSIQGLWNAVQGWQQNPGSAPGGTGQTGLLPGDAAGWARMLNQQTADQNAARQLMGQSPLDVRGGGTVREIHQGGTPNLGADPAWWATTNANVTATPRGENIQYGGLGLPASLAGLYSAGPKASVTKPNPPVSMPNSMVQ